MRPSTAGRSETTSCCRGTDKVRPPARADLAGTTIRNGQEIRSPKSETRNKSKSPMPQGSKLGAEIGVWVIAAFCAFGFVSSFASSFLNRTLNGFNFCLCVIAGRSLLGTSIIAARPHIYTHLQKQVHRWRSTRRPVFCERSDDGRRGCVVSFGSGYARLGFRISDLPSGPMLWWYGPDARPLPPAIKL